MEQSLTTQIRYSDSQNIVCSSFTPNVSAEEYPHARFTRLGPQALSDAELLSLLLKHVSKRDNAVEIGRRLIRKFGGICELGALSVSQLAEESGMNNSSAVGLLAAFEFAARCAGERTDGSL